MRLTPYSFNGHLLNSSDYRTMMPDDQSVQQGPVRVTYVPTQRGAPRYGSKVRQERIIRLHIEMLGDYVSQIDELKSWFPVELDDNEQNILIVIDPDNGDKQWYWMTTVSNQPKVDNCIIEIELLAGDTILRSVDNQSDSWAVAGSGDTHEVDPNPDGNADAYPVFSITPSAVKGGGYAYNRPILTYRNNSVAHPNRPTDLTDGGWDTTGLVSDSSMSNEINTGAGISDSDLTIPLDTPVNGGLPTEGGMCYVGTEQIKYTSIAGGNMTVASDGRGWGGTTAAAHADNAVMTLSHTLANGDDIRVISNGAEIPRWFGPGAAGFNQATTKIWCNLSYAAGVTLTLGSGIPGSGSISQIDIEVTRANKDAIKNLPPSGGVLIGSERFTYTSINYTNLTLNNVSREIDGTSAAVHAAGAAISWVPFSLYVIYGNPDADTPVINDKLEPTIDMLNSTNTSWVQDVFGDINRARSVSWVVAVDAQKKDSQSSYFTADDNTNADEYDDLGMRIQAYPYGSKYRASHAEITWTLYNPDGISAVNVTGKKYRVGSTWPGTASLEYTNKPNRWVTKFNEATPASESSWTGLTNNGANALGATYYFIRFRLAGLCAKNSGNMGAMEIDSLTQTLTNTPTVSLGAERSVYEISGVLTLVETGESILFNRTVALNETLVLDCYNSESYLEDDNTPGPLVLTDVDRAYWLRLLPGVTNTLQYDDLSGFTGTLGIEIAYKDRAR